MNKKSLLFTLFTLLFALTVQAGSGIFLRGGVTNWSALPEWEFADEGNGVYTLADKELYGPFKIGDSSWGTYNYGASSGTFKLGEPYTLAFDGGNITCSDRFKCSKITFTLTESGSATLLVEGSVATGDEITEVFVIGNNNGWDFNDTTGKLSATKNAGEYQGTVTMVAASGENVCYWRIYEYLGMAGSWGNPGGGDTSGHKTSGTLERNSEGCVTTGPGTYIVTFNINTGAFHCEDIPSVATGMQVMPQDAVLLTEVPEEVKILSLNNSLIDYNDQYKMFNDLSAQMGKKASWTKHTLLGKSLLTHYNEGDMLTAEGTPSAKMMVRSEAWTHIILQEQSATPRTNIKEFRESVRMWKEYIRENCPNPNAQIIIPMNWAYNDWSTFKENNKILLDNYLTVAQEQGVTICPVGLAYEAILDTEGSEVCNLLYSDNRHPTFRATYLAACMEYQLIYNEPANNISYRPESITAEEAQSMRRYAASTLSGFTNPVDHHAGKITFSAKIVDQFGLPMEDVTVTSWTVDGGGTLDENRVFTSNGTAGKYTVTATTPEFTESVVLTVGKAENIKKDESVVEFGEDTRSISENFDGMGVEATATLPTGWRIDKQLSAPRTVGTFGVAVEQTEQTGGNNIASNAKNGIWNFGAGNAAESTDRAIGGISTGVANATRCINVYLHIRNTGSSDIQGLNVAYDIEKYRKGNNAAGFAAQLYHSPDGVLWSTAGDDFYTFFAADNATEGYANAPGVSTNVQKELDVTVAAGKDLYLAWNLSVASGTAANGAQALAVDNVEITALNRGTGFEAVSDSDKALNVTVTDGYLRIVGEPARHIHVYSLNGTQVATATDTNEVNLPNIPRGIYMIKITTPTLAKVFKVGM